MSQDQWTTLDQYFTDRLLDEDGALDATLTASNEAGLPHINVAPNQGKLLMLMAQIAGARRVLEIGTLGGYSTIWLGRGIPADGHIDTLEFNPDHAEVAARNIRAAGLEGVVEIHVGKALDTMQHLVRQETAPYDLIFIDADKTSLPDYLEWSLKLSRPGTVIIADNVVRNGRVIDSATTDRDVQGVQRFIELAGANPRLESTAIQTVGSKGYDGFAMSVVKG
jgi:predicted O-methyltransferase YrrM